MGVVTPHVAQGICIHSWLQASSHVVITAKFATGGGFWYTCIYIGGGQK